VLLIASIPIDAGREDDEEEDEEDEEELDDIVSDLSVVLSINAYSNTCYM
jgi:hypothetical protein